MAEVGLVPFAPTGLQISQALVPTQRTTYSKHLFTQPRLLSIVCLMRYADWTFRETEVRLAEHRELRAALELVSVPDYTTRQRFMRRLSLETWNAVLAGTLQHLPSSGAGLKATVAVEATGLTSGAIRTLFVKDRGNGFEWRHWLKWLLVVDPGGRAIVAQQARRGPYNDCATRRPLVDTASQAVTLGCVLAEAEFDSERDHQHIRKRLKATSSIPAKRGKATWRIQGVRAQMRKRFPRRKYGQRSLVESVISAVKRKLSARAAGRSTDTQRLQALLLGSAYNIYRV